MNASAPAAARSLALAEVRAAVRAHRLTPAEVFPLAEAVGLVDLDTLKGAGLNSQAESRRLLAAHARLGFTQLIVELARQPKEETEGD